MFRNIKMKNCIAAAAGSVILSFGLYNIHSHAQVTEGGILGLVLLLDHWFALSPAVSSFVINAACYAIGFGALGKDFIIYSAVSAVSFSASYAVFEQFPPIWSDIYSYPLLACVLGAVFVGVGVGIAVRAGGAPGGDDALAMSISHVTGVKIQWVYLVSDVIVLALSATYIPLGRLAYSLLTVILSGQIVGFVQDMKFGKKAGTEGADN